MFLAGCMGVKTSMTATCKKTFDIERFNKSEDIPYQFDVIGNSMLSGNYQDFTVDDMYKKAVKIGEKNGADAVYVSSIRVMPKGRRVAYDPTLNVVSATSSASANSWGEINRDFDGGYSSIRNKNSGTVLNYKRIINVVYLKYRCDEKGNYLVKNVPIKDEHPVSLAPEIKEKK